MSVLNSFYTNSILVPLFCIPTMDGSLFISNLNTGGLSSSCEMIILRNNGHGGIIRVCIGIFTSALRNKKIHQILKKKYLTSLPQRIACYLTAYFDEKSPFERVVHFEWHSFISYFFENLTYFFIPEGGRKYAHTNSYNSAMTVIA